MDHMIKSRTGQIDREKCIANLGEGCGQFELVLIAAALARKRSQEHKAAGNTDHFQAPVNALLEIQDGKL
jgi:hypothetical protein